MCGIIGYVGARPATGLLLAGLRRLEYRGYDSAGICLVEQGTLSSVHALGALDQLADAAAGSISSATAGIGHTRWATHGTVSLENAHPLGGTRDDTVAVVLNGIVENHRDLRVALEAEGHVFTSQTDAETVVHLVEHHYRGDLVDAVGAAYDDLAGHFAFVVCHRDHPEQLVGARNRCPLVVGAGDGETFLASSIGALLSETRRVQLVEDGEIVSIGRGGARFFAYSGEEVERDEREIEWDEEAAEMDGYETFMQKEIHEQPAAVAATLAEHVRAGRLELEGSGLERNWWERLRRVSIISCGTSYHAGLVGRYLIEEWAKVPCEPDIASEWRYRNPLVEPETLVIGISQSGETADTIAAMRLAREKGATTLAITNMLGTQIAREVDAVLHTRAGIEMGVAATKTFTTQVALLALLALDLARTRGTLSEGEIDSLVAEVERLPAVIAAYLEGDHPIDAIAARHCRKPFFLYLGRHVGLPVCLEGALKLKEISYIPTEAYSAGEMKHGPIALLDSTTPVVCVATDSHVYDKLISNVEEARARGAEVIAVATDGNEAIQHQADDVVYVPRTHPLLAPAVAVVPLQQLAYAIARRRGLDVDRPRNLAKTVTVE